MIKYADVEKEIALKGLKTSADGLRVKEAESRLKANGKNALKEQKRKSVLGVFFSQFGDVMTIMLIAAACVSAAIAALSGDRSELVDTAIIVAIILLNAVIGTFQQYRADKAIEGLKKLNCITAKVKRGGKVYTMPAEELVIGDIVLLEEGDVVPADMRIITCNSLRCAEAALTGESEGVLKTDKKITDKKMNFHTAKNIAFSSTYVVGGSGEGAVIATGENTEIGMIAGMLKQVEKTDSPLERSLNKLGKIISAFVIAVAGLVFIIGALAGDTPLIKNFMTAVAVAVAAIPEGLPAVVTVIMAMGVQRMSREKVVIRKLKCVEALGSCTCICTDKTGTITCNKMKVVSCYAADGSEKERNKALEKVYACMQICNGAKESGNVYIGDSTEVALLDFVKRAGALKEYEKTGEIPFSSERKLMSVRAKLSKKEFVFVKGAPEEVLKRCDYIFKNGAAQKIGENDRADFLSLCGKMEAQALRVLAFAYKDGGTLAETGLTLCGCCGLLDDLREGVKEAVSVCKRAGISAVMITGDSQKTAFAIAKRAGICNAEDEVFTGEQLDGMTKPQLKEAVKRGRVFARVTPKHKNIIVKLKQAAGETVAMTGDGVNDAPAVKSADIGVVMGGSGTEVTKSVADMIITDDNFTTIVAGVKEGRRISSNIKKTIQFFLSTNLAEVWAILFVSFIFFGRGFLSSTQLLWLNLITDSFPVLALGVEKGEKRCMERPPQKVERALLSAPSVAFTLLSSLYIAGVTVGVYAFTLANVGIEEAVTAAFLTLTFAELFHVFNVRSGRSSAFCGIAENKVLLVTVLFGIGVNVALCLSPVKAAFSIAELPAGYWLLCFAAAVSVIPFCEVYKLCLCAPRFKKRLKRGGVRLKAARAK